MTTRQARDARGIWLALHPGREALVAALRANDGRIARTAAALEVSRQALWLWLRADPSIDVARIRRETRAIYAPVVPTGLCLDCGRRPAKGKRGVCRSCWRARRLEGAR